MMNSPKYRQDKLLKLIIVKVFDVKKLSVVEALTSISVEDKVIDISFECTNDLSIAVMA